VPPAFRAYRITHVDEGSPPAAAGLRADDVIETVDGRSMGEMPLGYLRDLFKLPGAAYTLTVRRGAESHTVRIQLPGS
jgi:C-terminal processing protease CtpA/Prc